MTSPEQTRTLVLMRHGKSDYPTGVIDHDRPLNARGRKQAAESGEWIGRNAPTVDAVLCSTSTRTRETLARTGITAPTRYEERIYGGEPETILQEIALTDPGVRTLLVVGHFPGIPEMALLLDDDPHSPASQSLIDSGFPTSAVAVLDTASNWDALTPACAHLRDVFRHGR